MTIETAIATCELLEVGMKTYDFGVDCSQARINGSFAILAVQALEALLHGEEGTAQADFATLAEELDARGKFNQA